MSGALAIHPKVAGATLAGALAILIVWILGLFHVPVTDVAAASLVTALSGFGGWLSPAGYPDATAGSSADLSLNPKTLATLASAQTTAADAPPAA